MVLMDDTNAHKLLVQQAFQKLKPTCVSLLQKSHLTPASTTPVLTLLTSLHATLCTLHPPPQPQPPLAPVLTPSLIAYVFFPLSTLLRRNPASSIPDRVLEGVLLCLNELWEEWYWVWDADAAGDGDVHGAGAGGRGGEWVQCWMLAGSVLLDLGLDEGEGDGEERGFTAGKPNGKGKGRRRDDETKAAAVLLLLTLLRPRSPVSSAAPTRPATLHALALSHLPLLGQTLSSLLTTALSPHARLQARSLALLRTLVADHFAPQHVPSFMPGVVSACCKAALGQGAAGPDGAAKGNGKGRSGVQRGETVFLALDVLALTVVRGIGDAVCRDAGLLRSVGALEELFDLVPGHSSISISTSTSTSTPSSSDPANSLNPPSPTTPPAPHSTLFTTPRTPAWQRATFSQLLLALHTLSPLLSHRHPRALEGMAALHAALLTSCAESLPDASPLALAALLPLSLSPFPEVSATSSNALRSALSPSNPTHAAPTAHLLHLALSALLALPRVLPAALDAPVQAACSTVSAACALALVPGLEGLRAGLGGMLGGAGGGGGGGGKAGVERWGWGLLGALRLVSPGVGPWAGSADPAKMLLGPSGANDSSSSPSQLPPFPPLTLHSISQRATLSALEEMFRALGRAGGEEALWAVEWFVRVGTRAGLGGGAGGGGEAAAGLWVAGRMLEGVAGVELGVDGEGVRGPGKRLARFARWMAREVAGMWDAGEGDGDEGGDVEAGVEDGQGEAREEDALLPVERIVGRSHIQTLLSLRNDTRGAHGGQARASSSQASAAPIHISLSLQLLALSAQILTSAFRPLFLHVLYPILHSLVAPSPTVSASALAALCTIAHRTAYASPANLLLANFDYALDAVSHRLTRTRLDVHAAQVLGVLVRVVGRDVVARAGDVVEECFERLDEFHGYSVLVEGLMAVLAEVIAVLEPEELPTPEKKSDVDVGNTPSGEDAADFSGFLNWFQHRNDPPPKAEVEDFGPTPQEPWTTPEKEDERPPEDDEAAPTPSQALGQQIVAKSLYFLTHGSPLIRARVLHLLAAATPLLRAPDLLPSVHAAWPLVLNRLEDREPFVQCEAAGFVTALVDHAGEFMYGRIWDDVWPRFRRLLLRLAAADTSSAMARRRDGAVGTESAYSTSHKLYKAVLTTMRQAVAHVRVRDQLAWEVGLLCRRFLRRETQVELQRIAGELFVELGKKNADAVWLLLLGTVGGGLSEEESVTGLPRFLREPKWDIVENVRIIMQSI